MIEFLSKVNFRAVLQYALYMLIVLVFQNMFFSQIRIFGVCSMFLPAAVVAVALFEGPVAGAVFALLLGYFADMSFIENTVLFTLLFPMISFSVGFAGRFLLNRQFLAYMIVAAAAIAVTAVVQMIKTALNDTLSMSMLSTVLFQILWSLPPAALVYFWPASRSRKAAE